MKFNYCIILLGLFALACEPEIETPDFRVTVAGNTFQAGEEIVFQFEGNADMIYFYSGEPSRQLEFSQGRTLSIAEGGLLLGFASGVTGGTQEDQLSMHASTDFSGDYDNLESVTAANWTDITDRFTFGTTPTFLSTSPQDLSDLLVPGQPIYFAYKYLTRPQAENGMARNWMIQNFLLQSTVLFNNSPITISDQANAGFRIVDQEPENAPSQSTITTSRVSLLGNVYKDPADPIYDPENPIYDPENPIYDPASFLYEPTAIRPTFVPYDPNSPYNDPMTENWAVSRGFEIEEVDLGPDRSTAIKGISNSALDEYRYSYNTPGTYTSYFIGKNATINGSKEIINEITVTVLP